GQGYGGIAGRLNALGIAPPGPPRGKPGRPRGWAFLTIRDLIQNPSYRGALVWNRRTFSKFNTVHDGQAQARPKHRMNKQDRNPEADWIVQEGAHQELVPPEVWHAVQRAMRLRSGETTPEQARATKRSSPYLLSGLVNCKRCGARWEG